jgi:hypothetical protein
MRNHEEKGSICKLVKRNIMAKNENETLFGRNCQVRDLKCELSDSIVIWHDEIIKKCELILTMSEVKLTHLENDIFEFRETNGRALLQLTKQVKFPKCGAMIYYATAEGFYLTVNGIEKYKRSGNKFKGRRYRLFPPLK